MNLIEFVKGVIRKMVGPKTLESVLHITPAISPDMKTAIETWQDMYMDKSPWLTKNIKSAGIPALIASEKARTATIEMDIKITGDSERAKFIRTNFKKVTDSIRENLEYGVALGGFVIKPYIVLGPYNKYIMEFNYTKATDFYPLSFSADKSVIEAAFVDRIVAKDVIYSKVEYHKLEGTQLIIRNYAFVSQNTNSTVNSADLRSELGEPIPLTSIASWANLAPEVVIGDMDSLLFAYFKMPEANTVDMNSPLGVSGFSRAVDLIKHADELYSDLLWEFEGGQLAVDVDRTALNPMKDAKGNVKEVLPALQDRLFRRNLDLGSDDMYNVFSPALRDKSIINGLNNQLMRIEDACALSRGTLSVVTQAEARTATELKILKQRSFAANQDIQLTLQNTLEAIIAIMDKYCDLYDIVPSGEYEVAFKWDDSIIVDKDTERQVDMLDVEKGRMSKVEYRMKWMGETEQQATEALKKIQEERLAEMEMQQSVIANNQPTEQNGSATTNAQATQNKLNRANESIETTKTSNGSN